MFDNLAEELTRMTGTQLAAAISDNHTAQVAAENRALVLAAAWADLHYREPGEFSPLVERATVVGGVGTPEIGEFCCLEFGALLGVGMHAGRSMIADALDLRHRFPRLWERVGAGQVRAWKARKVADTTRHLDGAAAADVDEAVHGYIENVPWPRFVKILTAAIVDADPALAAEREEQARTRRGVWATTSEDGIKTLIVRATSGDVIVFLATVNRIADILELEDRAAGRDADTVDVRRARAVAILAQPAQALALLLDHRDDPGDDLGEEEGGDGPGGLRLPPLPAGLDPRALAPKIVLHYHLSADAIRDGYGLARPADHSDPISLDSLKTWLADTGAAVQVRPVFDPDTVPAVDRYEIPMRVRAAVGLRDLAETFPYGSLSTRIDLDHTHPYDPNGPPGQTSVDRLAPLTRLPHRAATHGHWRKRQPEPGLHLWRSPKGWIWLVTNQGTLNLGKSAYSRAIWHAAKPAVVTAA